jgi:hypothetical protein
VDIDIGVSYLRGCALPYANFLNTKKLEGLVAMGYQAFFISLF